MEPNLYLIPPRLTGLRLYLQGKKSNCPAIHKQHLLISSKNLSTGTVSNTKLQARFYEKVQSKYVSHVCTAPVQSDEHLSVVTRAQLQVLNHGMRSILFLLLPFCTVLGATPVKAPEWDGSPGLGPKSGLISTLIIHHFSTTLKQPPRPADVNIHSAVYPGRPPVAVHPPKLLKFVDAWEMTRGPQESPGYWVVSGARLVEEKGKISLRVKCSLLTAIRPEDDDDSGEDE